MRMFLIYKYGMTDLEDILVNKKGMVQKYMQFRILREGRKKKRIQLNVCAKYKSRRIYPKIV